MKQIWKSDGTIRKGDQAKSTVAGQSEGLERTRKKPIPQPLSLAKVSSGRKGAKSFAKKS